MLGLASGAAVKLDADDAVTMGLAIGEGIESCLAARALGFVPCWALGSAGAITAFPVLGGIECLTILAENDDSNRRAVDACAARWHHAGREVVVVEPASGSDILDAMRGRRLMVEPAKVYTTRRWTPPIDGPPKGRFDDEITLDNIQGNKPKPGPKLVNAEALRNMTFPPIRYVVPGYLAEGCTILAGAPKLGKSWLVLEWAISKATGGKCMGSVETPEAEDVLYLALEDNLRRLQSRMDRLRRASGTLGPRGSPSPPHGPAPMRAASIASGNGRRRPRNPASSSSTCSRRSGLRSRRRTTPMPPTTTR